MLSCLAITSFIQHTAESQAFLYCPSAEYLKVLSNVEHLGPCKQSTPINIALSTSLPLCLSLSLSLSLSLDLDLPLYLSRCLSPSPATNILPVTTLISAASLVDRRPRYLLMHLCHLLWSCAKRYLANDLMIFRVGTPGPVFHRRYRLVLPRLCRCTSQPHPYR